MNPIQRVLRRTAWVPLVLLLAAPALAATEFSQYKCLNPVSAADDQYDYFSDNPINTEGFGEDGCAKLCKELNKICYENVKNRLDCSKTDDSFFFKLQTKLCDVYYTGDAAKSCKESIKAEKSYQKGVAQDLQEEGEFECEDAFGVDGYCPFDCADGALDDD